MSYNAFWGRFAGQVNVTRTCFAVSYYVHILVGNRFRSVSFQPMSISAPPPEYTPSGG